MNQTELFFARQNFLWKFQIYFLIGLGIFFLVTFIVACIYDKWKEMKYKRRNKQ